MKVDWWEAPLNLRLEQVMVTVSWARAAVWKWELGPILRVVVGAEVVVVTVRAVVAALTVAVQVMGVENWRRLEVV